MNEQSLRTHDKRGRQKRQIGRKIGRKKKERIRKELEKGKDER